MTVSLLFVAFTLFPAGALVLGTAYSLQEIYRIDERRIVVITLILAFMLFHQVNEVVFFLETAEMKGSAVGEVPETMANIVAAGSVYYVLCFTRRERALRESLSESHVELEAVNDRLELIFENVNDGILLVDLDDQEIIEANGTAHDLLRYDPGELVGLSPYDLHPHEPELFRELTSALRTDGGVVTEKLSCRRSDGSTMPAAVSASRTTHEGSDLLLVTIRDNTAREQYRTQVDLLGRVLRHNLRNDMSVVMGHLDSIAESVDDADLETPLDASLEKCQDLLETSEKTRRLNDVLETGHRRIGLVTDVVPLVEDVVDRYEREHPEARLDTDLPERATVRASENVVWAIENVVENAITHAESHPRVRITVGGERVVEGGRTTEWTTVTVADDGPGIPETEVAVLRDDTNRTATGHGSGLGLWIVQQIARAFDGQLDIDVDRHPDREFTTEVSLRLQPGPDDPRDDATDDDPPHPPPGNRSSSSTNGRVSEPT